MTPTLQRSAAASAALHVLALLALLLTLPHRNPPEPPTETAVQMDFVGPAQPVQRAQAPAPTPAPAPAPQPTPAPPAPQPQKPAPEAPLPPPPPPPPPPPSPAPAPPTATPPVPQPPPRESTEAAAPLPPPPPAPPAPPQATPPLPVPPPPVPTQAVASANTQPHPVKTPVPDSRELLNTLEKLRLATRQTEAPRARANPRQGGAPNAGGSPHGSDTAKLSADERAAIGTEVRRCWTYDPGAKGVDQMRVMLNVVTDGNGTAREATVAPEDQGRLADPVFRAFAERAVRAVLSPECANLPLPRFMLGQNRELKFRFSPL